MRDHARAPLGIDTTGIGTTGRFPDPSLIVHVSQASIPRGGGGWGGDLVSTLPGCVCRKGKDMGPFSASSE